MFKGEFLFALLSVGVVMLLGAGLGWIAGWDPSMTMLGFATLVFIALYLPEWIAGRRPVKSKSILVPWSHRTGAATFDLDAPETIAEFAQWGLTLDQAVGSEFTFRTDHPENGIVRFEGEIIRHNEGYHIQVVEDGDFTRPLTP